MSLISSTSGNIVFGGKGNEETLFVEPTVIKDVAEDDVVLESENFAPILPILRYTTFEDAKGKLDQLSPTALALYVFTEDMEEAHRFIDSSLTGTVAINDAMAQIAPSSLPFGGVGQSGMGAYRGLASIDTFSHKQSMVNVPTTTQFEALLEWRYAGKESMETVAFVKTNMEARLT
jgi:acyl-CoA reductase-like NAD-dependent aldehyde dehydrogenase